MIDTEPWSGSVNKMILGSFEESQFADVQEEPSSGPSSPALIGMAGRPVSQTGTNMTEEKKRNPYQDEPKITFEYETVLHHRFSAFTKNFA
ncbi:MAG: hypothetical protein LQ340_004083 [Diploschistes diacapsis]|nr:MAG: hypothetical protein LQ340_004083 [Diploschistes diacapsis]